MQGQARLAQEERCRTETMRKTGLSIRRIKTTSGPPEQPASFACLAIGGWMRSKPFRWAAAHLGPHGISASARACAALASESAGILQAVAAAGRVAVAFLLAALALCNPLAALAAPDRPADRPNVLFIIVNDLRSLLGAYGFPEMHTPSIDRLAAQGVLFERAYVQWPVCGPSRASFLSGLRPETSGVHYIGQRIQTEAPDAVTLPRHFRRNGYRALSVGKVYHHRDEDLGAWSEPPWNLPDAAVNWQGYASPASHALRRRQWQDALAADPEAQLFQFNAHAVESADLEDAAYRDGQIALKALTALNANASEPFFLAVGFVKPHLPFAAPKRYWDLYNRAALALPEDQARPAGASEVPYLYSELRPYYGIPDDLQLSEAAIRELLHGYRAAVSFIDAQVGLLLDELRRLKLADNTIVVLIGDHGFHLGEQGIWGKHSLFERSLRTPLILRVPGRGNPDVRVNALVEFVDIYPTLCELAGLKIPPGLDGRSFAPLLDAPSQKWKSAARSQYRPFLEPHRDVLGRSIRTERYRYTEWRKAGEFLHRELYDLGDGGAERANLAGDPKHAALIAELAAKMEGGSGD